MLAIFYIYRVISLSLSHQFQMYFNNLNYFLWYFPFFFLFLISQFYVFNIQPSSPFLYHHVYSFPSIFIFFLVNNFFLQDVFSSLVNSSFSVIVPLISSRHFCLQSSSFLTFKTFSSDLCNWSPFLSPFYFYVSIIFFVLSSHPWFFI